MRLMVFFNPGAGSGGCTAEGLGEMLAAHGHEVVRMVDKDGDLASALAEPCDAVVVAGGDGTVGRLIPRMLGRGVPLAILPMGTANNIARSLCLDGAPHDLPAGWPGAEARPFNVGTATGPWGRRHLVESLGLGPVARAMARVDSGEVRVADAIPGSRAAVRSALGQAGLLRSEVRVDGEPLPSDILALEVMNISRLGPCLRLSPSADPGDGKLEVAFVRAGERADMMAWLDDGGHGDPVPCSRVSGRRVAIAWAGMGLRVDDDFHEHGGVTVAVRVELDAGAIRVLVPPGKPNGG